MYLVPLNYDRFFKKKFSHTHIAKAFLEISIENVQFIIENAKRDSLF